MTGGRQIGSQRLGLYDGEAPGLVGVVAQDTARFSMFATSLTSLDVPTGTQIKWVIGHQVAASTNDLCRALLDSDAAWLWVLGDDHVFQPNIVWRLLSHGDLDIVVPLCLTRHPPYQPVALIDIPNGGRHRMSLHDPRLGGLVAIDAAGSAGMLIRRRVLERMAPPWFESGVISDTGEDIYFCDKARDLGFRIYCDLDAHLGHCTTAVVWPVQTAEGWTYGFGFPGGLKFTMPPDAWDAVDVAAGRERVTA